MMTIQRDPSGMTNDEMTRAIYERIVGDGTESNPGLDKRVDRLESKMAMVFGGLVLIVSAILTYLGTWVMGFVTGKKP